MSFINIAIDGPAGAGKSSVAKAVSKQLGYIYVDTGALYRAIGLYVLRCGKDPANREDVIPLLGDITVKLCHVNGEQRVKLGDEDVSDAIRTQEVSMAASNVSAIPEVRSFLFDLQRDIARNNNIVMDGRDIGTVVLPDADVKIFLTASAEERARRRYRELLEKGEQIDYNDVLQDVIKRDKNDSTRAIAPLKQAEDAVLIDTTGQTLEESVATLIKTIKERL